MSVQGRPVFDGLALGTISADFTGANVLLKARAAFVSTKDGTTHGWTEGVGSIWSKETIQKLRDLALSMEKDLATLHLAGTAQVESEAPTGIQPSGLGEHVAGEAPQV